MLIFSLSERETGKIVSGVIQTLERGGIAAYPTESFYALGVKADNEAALNRLYRIKKRPLEKPMPLIAGDAAVLKPLVKCIPSHAEGLIKKYWPGPLTIVFDASRAVPDLLIGQRRTVAVRVPGDSFALSLARAARFPITATSANPAGKPPARTHDEVITYFGEDLDFIVAAGATPGGRPSTIVDVTVSPPLILRQGRIRLKQYAVR